MPGGASAAVSPSWPDPGAFLTGNGKLKRPTGNRSHSTSHPGAGSHPQPRAGLRVSPRHLLGQLLLGVGAELQQPHEHGRHVHVGLPDGEAAADEVDGGPAHRAVRRQLGAGRLQQQERERLAWRERSRSEPRRHPLLTQPPQRQPPRCAPRAPNQRTATVLAAPRLKRRVGNTK